MPNLWTTTGRQLYESFSGPHTVDTEFNLKVEECKLVERNIANIQRLYRNFYKNTSGLKSFFEDVYSTFGACYENNSPYWSTVNEILIVHQEADMLYDILAENINRIYHVSSEWDKYFGEVRSHLKNRDESRFVYDHYDGKMERLVNKRNKKAHLGKTESARFLKSFERNDVKYRSAADNYIRMSMFSYKMMNELMEYRSRIVNPVLIQLVQEESKFFTAIGQLFSRLQNIQQTLQTVDSGIQRQPCLYDPTKFIRGRNLVSKIDVHTLNPESHNLMEGKKSFFSDQVYNTNDFTYNPKFQNMKSYDVNPNLTNVHGINTTLNNSQFNNMSTMQAMNTQPIVNQQTNTSNLNNPQLNTQNTIISGVPQNQPISSNYQQPIVPGYQQPMPRMNHLQNYKSNNTLNTYTTTTFDDDEDLSADSDDEEMLKKMKQLNMAAYNLTPDVYGTSSNYGYQGTAPQYFNDNQNKDNITVTVKVDENSSGHNTQQQGQYQGQIGGNQSYNPQQVSNQNYQNYNYQHPGVNISNLSAQGQDQTTSSNNDQVKVDVKVNNNTSN